MKKVFALLGLVVLVASCTSNNMAKNWGGTMRVDVPGNQKVVNVTWKDDELWYLTEPMDSAYQPKVLTFHEKSSYGINEGTVTLTETKVQ